MSDTPNMGLTLPLVSITLGPTYASENNAAFEEVDAHDHTSGKGVQIPSAGLNINANLNIDDYSLTSIGSADLSDLPAVITTGDRRIFSYSGELYFRDDAGNNVQITSGGAVSTAGTGNISGLSAPASAEFSALNSQFGWFYDTGKQAVMQSGDLQVFPFDGAAAYTNYWTLKSPTALASNLTLTLPLALGATTLPLVGTSAGVLSFGTGLQLGNGSAATPTYGFSGDTNTGMYNTGTADTLGFSTGGTVRLTLNTTSFTSTLPFRASTGNAAAPSICFAGDVNTGLYLDGSDQFGMAAGGTEIALLNATNVYFNGDLSAASLQTAGGGAFKVRVLVGTTGSLTSASSATIVSGITTVYSMSGVCKATSGGTGSWNAIASTASATSSNASFGNTANTSVILTNISGGTTTLQYRIVLIYA